MIDKSRIAILTTVANFELYEKTSQLFPKDIRRYVIDGRKGMYGIDSIIYMMSQLKNEGIDWLVMADEDVIFTNSELIFSIIEQMETNHLTVSGVRDGGEISHRNQNPYAINTFFSVLHFKHILKIWNKKEVLKHQFVLDGEFNDDLSALPYAFDTASLYEPYYCFYFWLRRQNEKFLFLKAQMDEDGITNTVLYQDKVMLCHTWYARAYGTNEKHTTRINKQLLQVDYLDKYQFSEKPTVFKHKTFYLVKRLKQVLRLIRLKLNG